MPDRRRDGDCAKLSRPGSYNCHRTGRGHHTTEHSNNASEQKAHTIATNSIETSVLPDCFGCRQPHTIYDIFPFHRINTNKPAKIFMQVG